jgi:hypothetical protein
MQTENLRTAILAALRIEKIDGDDDAAAVALTNILVAFAAVIRGPAPEVQGVELVADDTPAQFLAELRGLRSDLVALHLPPHCANADSSQMPPPVGAKCGYWQSVVGSSQPYWIETSQQTRTPPLESPVMASSYSEPAR